MTGPSRATFLAHSETTEQIIGAMYDVHRELGHGFTETIYRRAMALALRQAGRDVMEEALLHVYFRGRLIGEFRADLVIDRCVLVEIKAATNLEPYAEVQILNYLKAAGGGVGLLVNFGRSATFKRRVVGDAAARSLPHLDVPPPLDLPEAPP